MSLVSGFQPIFVPIVIPPTVDNTAVVFANFITIPRGVYVVSFSYSITPLQVGANILNLYWTMTQSGLGGTLPSFSILELHDSAPAQANADANGSMTNIVNIPNDNTQISLSFAANTSAGNYQTSTIGTQVGFTKVSFLKVA